MIRVCHFTLEVPPPDQYSDFIAVNVQFHEIGGRDISSCQDEMSHFCKTIRNNVDHIETIQLWEFTYKIRLNPLPRSIRSRNQLQFSKFALVPMFRSPTGVTSLYISLNPIG